VITRVEGVVADFEVGVGVELAAAVALAIAGYSGVGGRPGIVRSFRTAVPAARVGRGRASIGEGA
jgi:hypothetical protein